MRKRIWLITILLGLFFLLSGCNFTGGSYSTTISKENNGKNNMEMIYSNFSGYRYTRLKLKAEDEIELKIQVNTDSGNLKVAMIDPNENEIFSVENPENQVVKKIKIDTDGKYEIKVQGNHSGSYKIKWNIKPE